MNSKWSACPPRLDRWTICDKGHTHWGAIGAAGLLFCHLDSDMELTYLLERRWSTVDHNGRWCIPGGAIRRGESAEIAAQREAAEEIGPLPYYEVTKINVQECGGGWKFYILTATVARPFLARCVSDVLRLPRQSLLAKMAVIRRRAINGPEQVKSFDDGGRPEIQLLHKRNRRMHVPSSKSIDFDGEGFCDTDGISNLDLDPIRQPFSDNLSRRVTAKVCGASIDFRGVLSAKGSASMPRRTAIRIGDDFSSRDATVSGWAAKHKASGGIDNEANVSVKPLPENTRAQCPRNIGSYLGALYLGRMLSGDENISD